jgi:hypothetical protein
MTSDETARRRADDAVMAGIVAGDTSTDSSKTDNTHGVLISILRRQGDALMTCG